MIWTRLDTVRELLETLDTACPMRGYWESVYVALLRRAMG